MLGRLPTGGLSRGGKTAVGDDVTSWDTQERQMKGLWGPVFSVTGDPLLGVRTQGGRGRL